MSHDEETIEFLKGLLEAFKANNMTEEQRQDLMDILEMSLTIDDEDDVYQITEEGLVTS